MTSPAYSDRRVFWHELRLTVRQFWLLPVVGAVYFFLVMNLPVLLILDSYSYSGYANFEMYVQGYDAGIQYAIPAFAGLVALCVFFFLFQSRAPATYFSLGVRRGTLFGIRYMTGAAFVALPLLLACVGSRGSLHPAGVGPSPAAGVDRRFGAAKPAARLPVRRGVQPPLRTAVRRGRV